MLGKGQLVPGKDHLVARRVSRRGGNVNLVSFPPLKWFVLEDWKVSWSPRVPWFARRKNLSCPGRSARRGGNVHFGFCSFCSEVFCSVFGFAFGFERSGSGLECALPSLGRNRTFETDPERSRPNKTFPFCERCSVPSLLQCMWGWDLGRTPLAPSPPLPPTFCRRTKPPPSALQGFRMRGALSRS